MARITPISRVRSSTFMLIVPIRPILPTMAVRNAMTSRKVVRVLRPMAELVDDRLPGLNFGDAKAAPLQISLYARAQRALLIHGKLLPAASGAVAGDPVGDGHIGFVDALGEIIVAGVGHKPGALAGQLEEAHHHPTGLVAVDAQAQCIANYADPGRPRGSARSTRSHSDRPAESSARSG